MIDHNRKTAEIVGFAVFKWIVRFFLIIAAYRLGGKLADACIIIMLVIDLTLQSVIIVTEANAIDLKEKAWADLLTNRLFYKNFIEEIRRGGQPDVDDIFAISTKEAVADINRAREDAGQNLEMKWYAKFGWGAGSFFSNALGFATGYGIPYLLARLVD